MPLAESIGGFIRDEIMIVMGDMAKIMFKVHFLAGSTLKKRNRGLILKCLVCADQTNMV